MIEAGRCVEVLNPYDWLPGHGENSVQLYTEGLDLIVLVAFDGQDDEWQEKKMHFKNAFGFYRGSFPGPGILGIGYSVEDTEKLLISGCLVEFPDSEAAYKWRNLHVGSQSIKHYKIVFFAENLTLEIFADSVQLVDVQR